jgi:hypothetical protein
MAAVDRCALFDGNSQRNLTRLLGAAARVRRMKSTSNTRVAAAAGIAVALVAAGGAYAASKLHHGRSSSASAARGPGAPPFGMRGYDFRGAPPTGGFGFRHDGPGAIFDTVTGYLGISPQELFTQLRSGKTPAQIANATSGKSASGLVDALVAAEQKEHPDESASDIRARVSAFVNGAGFGFRGRPPGRFAPPATHV